MNGEENIPTLAFPGENQLLAVPFPDSLQQIPAKELSNILMSLDYEIIRQVGNLSDDDRKALRRKIKTAISQLRAEKNKNQSRASLSKTIGSVLGVTLATGAVLALATNPFAWPLLTVAVSGAVTAAGGFAAGHKIEEYAIDQQLLINLLEDMLEELRNA
jgi:preprotein translocase subunit SecF